MLAFSSIYSSLTNNASLGIRRQVVRLEFRFDGKEKRLSLGVYPDVTPKYARDRRDTACKLLADGIDTSENRRAQKLARIDSAVCAPRFQNVVCVRCHSFCRGPGRIKERWIERTEAVIHRIQVLLNLPVVKAFAAQRATIVGSIFAACSFSGPVSNLSISPRMMSTPWWYSEVSLRKLTFVAQTQRFWMMPSNPSAVVEW